MVTLIRPPTLVSNYYLYSSVSSNPQVRSAYTLVLVQRLEAGIGLTLHFAAGIMVYLIR